MSGWVEFRFKEGTKKPWRKVTFPGTAIRYTALLNLIARECHILERGSCRFHIEDTESHMSKIYYDTYMKKYNANILPRAAFTEGSMVLSGLRLLVSRVPFVFKPIRQRAVAEVPKGLVHEGFEWSLLGRRVYSCDPVGAPHPEEEKALPPPPPPADPVTADAEMYYPSLDDMFFSCRACQRPLRSTLSSSCCRASICIQCVQPEDIPCSFCGESRTWLDNPNLQRASDSYWDSQIH